MVILRKYFALLGLILGFLLILTPMLKVPIKGNWNLYQTDTLLFGLTYLQLAVLALLFFMRSVQAFRWMTLLYFGWFILALAAVYLKINNYFGFSLVDGLLAKSIHLRWGWIVFGLSALLLLVSTKKSALTVS